MSRYPLLAALLLIALPACTLTVRPDPDASATLPPVTATLSEDVRIVVETLQATPTILSTATPIPTLAPIATATNSPPSPTLSPTPTVTISAPPSLTPAPALPVPTRTIPGPATVVPIDDGSGNVILGTGSSTAFNPVPGLTALPDTLYYLSDAGGLPQVFRLRIGLNHPDQLSYSTAGAAAFSVAPDGTLAYVDRAGLMVVGGIPFLPPNEPDGSLPRITALVWSPGGDWLAYTLGSPEPAASQSSVWLRNSTGTTITLASSADAGLVFSGPLIWHPDGAELLVGVTLPGGTAAARIGIASSVITPLWDDSLLAPGTYARARWTSDGAAILALGADRLLRLDSDPMRVTVLLDASAGLALSGMWPGANGALALAGQSADGALGLYALLPGQPAPSPLTTPLTAGGAFEALWDRFGQQVVIVTYEVAGDPFGTASLRDAAGVQYDLTPLIGTAAGLQWGPAFQYRDWARVQTTGGEPFNIRAAPSLQGAVLLRLVSGTRVGIIGGPRLGDGLRWWQIRTPDGAAGWAAEAVTDAAGQRFRTLLPVD